MQLVAETIFEGLRGPDRSIVARAARGIRSFFLKNKRHFIIIFRNPAQLAGELRTLTAYRMHAQNKCPNPSRRARGDFKVYFVISE